MMTRSLVISCLSVWAVMGATTMDDTVKDDANITKGGKSPQLADSKGHLTPLEQGMLPVFFITRYFLNNILQPDSGGPPEVVIQSIARYIDGPVNHRDLLVQLETNWQPVTMYYLGFAICLVIGLVFIIMMPIVGFCFCCCRNCGRCGGDAGHMDPEYARCKQVTYTIVLLLLATSMLAAVVCAFVTNDLFHTQLTDRDRGYISNVNRSINGLEKYLDSTVTELKTDLSREINIGFDKVTFVINHTGETVVEQVKGVTRADELFHDMESLADDIPKLRLELQGLSRDMKKTKENLNQINKALSNVRSDIVEGLRCGRTECRRLRGRVKQELKVRIDLGQLPDVTPIIEAVTKYNDVKQLVYEAIDDFNKLGTKVNRKLEKEIKKAVRELDSSKSTVDSKIFEISKTVANVSGQVGSANKYLERVPKEIYTGAAVFYGVGLSCLFLLIVMLIYMGITFGVCGERPYDDARFCNKGQGANFLMASAGFMFLTSWFLMLVTTSLFLIGAPLQTEVCRHLMSPLNSPFIDRIDSYFNIGQYLYGSTNSEKLTIKEVLQKCENNTAIYNALKLNRTYDIGSSANDILARLEPDIRRLADDVRNIGYQDIRLVPIELRNKLEEMKSDSDFRVNFDPAIAETLKPVIVNLPDLLNDIRRLGINDVNLDRGLTTLEGLNLNEVEQLRNQLKKINSALLSLKRINAISEISIRIGKEIATVEQKLSSAQQADSMAKAAMGAGNKIIDIVKNLVLELADLIENEIGRCRPIYDSYYSLVSASCDDVLNPFNTFWCAHGLCLLLFIPTIIVCVKLAGLYRKTDKYVGKRFESLGSSSYTGDHIPLDDVRQPPPYRDGRGIGAYEGSAPPLEYGQGMLDFEMPYAVPARKNLYANHRDNRPLLDH